MVGQKQDILSILESRVSSWVKMKRVLALVMMFKSKLLSKISEGKICLDSKSNDLIDVYTYDGRGQKVYHQNGSKEIIWNRSQNHEKQWKKSIH